ncbi:hypothetical protein GCM10009646_89830 [Streptomyces aureus]
MDFTEGVNATAARPRVTTVPRTAPYLDRIMARLPRIGLRVIPDSKRGGMYQHVSSLQGDIAACHPAVRKS